MRATLALAGRALRNSGRRPQLLVPMLVFPSMFLAVNVGGLERATELPGFPNAGFLDFQLAAAITQALLLGGVSAGIAVALEIESGFFDRLVTSPVPRSALVFGRLLATGIISLGITGYFIVVGLLFGADFRGGVPGVALVLVIGAVAGTGFGAIGTALALRARNASTVQGIFPIVFVVLFLSSAFFPRGLLQEPADSVARYNPLSYIADGLRDPIISSVSAAPVVEGLVAAAAVTAAAVALSLRALSGRLREA